MSSFHVIKAGDTLWGISKKYQITVKELSRINSISAKKIHNLHIGQKIYLVEDENNIDKYETKLKIILMDLSFNPILKATIQLEFDGKIITRNTSNASFDNILVEDHSKGLKVYFKNIQGDFDLIANHKSLPIGTKILRLTSRKVKVKGTFYPKEGVVQDSTTNILKYLKSIGKPIIDGVKGGINDISENTGKAKTVASSEKLQMPQDRNEQKRTENGNSTHVIAFQFTEDNLLLKPINNKYRAYIMNASKKHGFAPQALTAFIEAEAAKKSTGEWNEKSYNKKSKAAGLTQFLEGTWLEMCSNSNSLVGQYVAKHSNLSRQEKLDLRYDGEMSIDAAAAYAVCNFKASKLPYQNLIEPSAIAKFAYLLHHEGAGGARQFVNNSFSQDRAKYLLYNQMASKQADEILKRYNNDAKVAYGAWLRNYIDGHINIYQYVVDKRKTSGVNLSMDQTIKLLKGQSIPNPTPKTPNSAPVNNPSREEKTRNVEISVQNGINEVGGADSWHNPLDICKLRTAGLANAKGATFGKVRDNGKKNHQGVDLQVNPGNSIYAVCSGTIVLAKNTGGDYGKVIVLKVDISDLPDKQKKQAQKNITGKYIYFFYAHLSDIKVNVDDIVDVGEKLGLSGATGNAKAMTTIAKGAHLHFEARSSALLGKGLVGRIDPIPFINAQLIY